MRLDTSARIKRLEARIHLIASKGSKYKQIFWFIKVNHRPASFSVIIAERLFD